MRKAIKLTKEQAAWLAAHENRLAGIRQQLAVGELVRSAYLLGATGVDVSNGEWQLDLTEHALFQTDQEQDAE